MSAVPPPPAEPIIPPVDTIREALSRAESDARAYRKLLRLALDREEEGQRLKAGTQGKAVPDAR